MSDPFTHETDLTVYDAQGKPRGEIGVRITYRVTVWPVPARIRWDENDHPAEPAEIDVIHLEMTNAPKHGRPSLYIDGWEWLTDWAQDWCDENANELAGQAKLQRECA
jgi:hypothetical protein